MLERAAEEALRRRKLKVLWGHRLQSLTVDGADPPGGGREARPGGDRLPRRANRVARRAKRDDPAGLCHRRRRVRLGRAADGRHRDGGAWPRPDLLRLRDRGDGRASRRSARHSRSRPDERLLAPRGGAMPLGIPDSGRLGTRGIDGAARAADRREGSLVHGAADADLLVDARRCSSRRLDAELRHGRHLAGRGRRAPGGSGRRAQHELGAGRSARTGSAHIGGSGARGERRRCLEEFATETHEAWQRLLGAGRAVRALPGADPWVRQTAARILACIPASGDDLEPLLEQIGLTIAR